MTNLIIRSSYAKIPDNSLKSNIGDLLKTSILVNNISKDFLWLTDSRGKNFLKHFIDDKKLISYEEEKAQNLPHFSNIYNVDNHVSEINVFSKLVGNWHGFIFNGQEVYPENIFIKDTQTYRDSETKINWQQCLIQGLGFEWQEQDYAFPIGLRQKETTEVGLNYHVHPEWKSKHWPMEYWQKLEEMLSKQVSISWQRGLNDFEEYLSWIDSCKVIVTPETLGLHLASAFRKKTIALVGAAENREFSYGRVKFISPSSRECMPCNSKDCRKERHCMRDISPKEVRDTILEEII